MVGTKRCSAAFNDVRCAAWVKYVPFAPEVCVACILSLLVVLYKWFSGGIGEHEGGLYSPRIDTSFRWSMS